MFLLRDASRYRPPPPGFRCGERMDEDAEDEQQRVGSVTFYCTAPPASSSSECPDLLQFSCRKRSQGVLLTEESKVRDEDMESAYAAVDPNFFDPGYTLAGATGFQIWAGTRLLLESLTWPTASTLDNYSDHPTLVYWQERIAASRTKPARILELGAGIGMLGINLAAAGAQVLLTDLTTLVENATYPNVEWNQNKVYQPQEEKSPEWLQESSAAGGVVVPIGRGWAATAALDWTLPLERQLSPAQYNQLDLIVASDCVWLVSMLDSLLDTVASIFAAAAAAANVNKQQQPTLLLSFQRRDTAEGDDSANFTTINRIIQAIQHRNWCMECLAWRPVQLDSPPVVNDIAKTEAASTIVATAVDEKEVFVFAIHPLPLSNT